MMFDIRIGLKNEVCTSGKTIYTAGGKFIIFMNDKHFTE